MKILVGTISYLNDEEVVEGLLFGTNESEIQITRVTGLETPPIRNNYGPWSGKDGGYMSSQLYSGREITIEGFYTDTNANCLLDDDFRTDPYSTREKLTNGLQIRQLYPIFFQLISGKIFYTEGYMIDFKMDFDNYKTGKYSVTFYCPYYELMTATEFGNKESIWQESLLYKERYGGHLVPETIPVLFELGYHATTINYKGLIPSWPKITLKGPSNEPITILNATTNKYIRIHTTIVAGQTLVVDMAAREVTVNGKSISMSIDENSDWWYLRPGENRIYLLTGENDDTFVANICWTNNYQGM